MAYFSYGTQGIDWKTNHCFNCRNFRDLKDGRGFGCPVYDLHILYNGNGRFRDVLDFLIPQLENGDVGECSMFLKKLGKKVKIDKIKMVR